MSPYLIWFRLVDTTGQSYKGTSDSSILSSSLAFPVVDQFRDAVKAKHSNKLSSVDAADLIVYKNQTAFDKENPLKSSNSLLGLGKDEENAIIVVVPINANPPITGISLQKILK
jgi:hypothetical protein